MPIGPIIMITWAEILFVVPWAYTVRWLFCASVSATEDADHLWKIFPDDLIKK